MRHRLEDLRIYFDAMQDAAQRSRYKTLKCIFTIRRAPARPPRPTSTSCINIMLGAGQAHHLKVDCPGASFAVLERRSAHGGTWDLMKYLAGLLTQGGQGGPPGPLTWPRDSIAFQPTSH